MKVAFRVDASMRIGTGHVVRCVNLAKILRERGAGVSFICREHEGHLAEELARESFPLHMLPAPPRQPAAASEDYAEWLGVPPARDAEETLAVLADGVDWVVVDHYGLGAAWQSAVRAGARRVMVIDDLPERRHDCDLLLDQNVLDADAAGHAARAPGAQVLAGPRYALLRGEYVQQRVALPPDDSRNGVLVFFGGTDPGDLTGLGLAAMSLPQTAPFPVTLVLGPNYPFGERLRTAAAARAGTSVLGPQPHLAQLMAQSGLALGGGGVTTWERMCLGLPAVVVSLAENQRPSCEALARSGLIAYAGHFDEVTPQSLAALVVRTAGDPAESGRLARAGMHMVDGLGARRAAEALVPTARESLTLRRARASDASLYFGWVNDAAVRASAFESAPVAWATHEAWFARRLADPASALFVMEAHGLPVGQVRFEQSGGEATIDYTLDPLVRGRGWAARLIKAGMQSAGSERFRAEVRPGNVASLAVFRKMGFREEAGHDGRRVFTRARGPIAA